MKIILTESQYRKYKSLFEQSVYDDSEDDYEDNYIANQPIDKEGMVVEGEISGLPIKFTYSEEKVNEDNETEYFGEIQFYGDEFLGVIATDKRGYLIDVDFYSRENS